MLAFAVVAAIFIAAYAASEHQRQNDGLPLVRSAFVIPETVTADPPQPRYLFAPCPLAPQNFQPPQERDA